MFPDAKLKNLVAPSSYHFPILLDRTLVAWSHRIKRSFKFENALRIEDGLNEVVHNSWLKSARNNVINKLSVCAEDMTHWSKTHCNKLQIDIEKCRNQPSRSCGINGIQDEAQFDNLRKKLNHLLVQDDMYWRQRPKTHWFRDRDLNTKFFHAAATSRKKSIKSFLFKLMKESVLQMIRGCGLLQRITLKNCLKKIYWTRSSIMKTMIN